MHSRGSDRITPRAPRSKSGRAPHRHLPPGPPGPLSPWGTLFHPLLPRLTLPLSPGGFRGLIALDRPFPDILPNPQTRLPRPPVRPETGPTKAPIESPRALLPTIKSVSPLISKSPDSPIASHLMAPRQKFTKTLICRSRRHEIRSERHGGDPERVPAGRQGDGDRGINLSRRRIPPPLDRP